LRFSTPAGCGGCGVGHGDVGGPCRPCRSRRPWGAVEFADHWACRHGNRRAAGLLRRPGHRDAHFPVPQGLVPVTLNAIVELPVNVRSGTLTVTQDERTIARVPIPPADQAPIVIPLAGVEIVDNSVTVTMRTYLVPLEGYCLDPTNPLRLVTGP